MSEKDWKLAEREFAAYFGTNRIPVMGREGHDIETNLLRIEHKFTRRQLPPYLLEATQQLAEMEHDKVPAIGLTLAGQASKRGSKRRYIIFELEEFIKLCLRIQLQSSSRQPITSSTATDGTVKE